MSPEQARGRPVDKRADIWAFGCLAVRAVDGPAGVRRRDRHRRARIDREKRSRVVASCRRRRRPPSPGCSVDASRKIRRRRLRDIGDAIVELDTSGTESPAARRARLRCCAARALAPSSRVARGGVAREPGCHRRRFGDTRPFACGRQRRPRSRNSSSRFKRTVARFANRRSRPTDGTSPTSAGPGSGCSPSASGSRANFPAPRRPIRPFWSPAGDWIAYFRSETLLKVPISGGPVVKVANLACRAVATRIGIRRVGRGWHDHHQHRRWPAATARAYGGR